MPDPADAAGWVRPGLSGALAGGVCREILLAPHPLLRALSQPAGYLSAPGLQRLAADLLATMYAAGGRGLAAPQIGELRRVFVMDAGWKAGRPDPQVMLDPDILTRSDEVETRDEACLSIPGQPVAVARPVGITLAWYDLEGLHHQRVLSGGEARIAQHEIDHLDGRLILDHLP